MSRKSPHWLLESAAHSRDPASPIGSAVPNLSEALVPYAESIPWPLIVVDNGGTVIYLNAAMRATGRALPVHGSRALQTLFPEYFAALKGEPCWLTQQEAVVSRQLSPNLALSERIWVRRLLTGAGLIIMDESRLQHLESAHAQAARLASLGFMLATVSHEISNPLTAVHSILQVLQSSKGATPAVLEKGLRNIASSVRRILAITRKLNGFARIGDAAASAFPIDEAIDDAAASFGYDSLGERIELRHALNAEAWVFGHADQLHQIFHNIFLNAAQAMQGAGAISVTTTAHPHTIEITIRDTGPGIPAAARAKVFEPFFTTKPSGEGTGLGLAISYEIAHEHDGTIHADNHPEGGAVFVVTLPRHVRSTLQTTSR